MGAKLYVPLSCRGGMRRSRSLQLVLVVTCSVAFFFMSLCRFGKPSAGHVTMAVPAGARDGYARDGRAQVYNNTLYRPGTEGAVHAQFDFGSPCSRFPNTDDILLVMKTGASEAYDKLPAHLLTSLQCLPDFLLFSDLVSLPPLRPDRALG